MTAGERVPSRPLFSSAIVLIGVSIAVALVGVAVSGSAFVQSARGSTDTDFITREQAAQLARTGLSEAINWLRRQPRQPVTEFAPSGEVSLDPGIGLVREFEIARGVWGRYEVRPVADLSAERGYVAMGTVWRLRCVAFVFERQSKRSVFDREHFFHTEVLETEVTRLGLRLPGQAALCVREGGRAVVGAHGRVSGGASAVGIYYGPERGVPSIDGGRVTGVAAMAPAASAALYDDSVRSVFGVDEAALLAMADDYVTRPRPNSICCLMGREARFTAARPLRGSGILYVNGDLTIDPGSASAFTGLIYVAGNLTVGPSNALRGAVVVTGKVSFEGSLAYDDDVVHGLQDTVGAYRISRHVRRSDGD